MGSKNFRGGRSKNFSMRPGGGMIVLIKTFYCNFGRFTRPSRNIFKVFWVEKNFRPFLGVFWPKMPKK